MSRDIRLLAGAAFVLLAMLTAGCTNAGIGMGVPTAGSGARWGSGTAGPDVFVGGGPVLR
jgi:hypothetical protein